MDGCGLQLVLIDADGRRLAAGKTTFVKRHLTGEFEKKYERELDPGAHEIPVALHCITNAQQPCSFSPA